MSDDAIIKYELITYDVWGNVRDGFQVNQAFHTGKYVEIPKGSSDSAINRRLGARGVEWEGDEEGVLYGTDKRNGRPIVELHAVIVYDNGGIGRCLITDEGEQS